MMHMMNKGMNDSGISDHDLLYNLKELADYPETKLLVINIFTAPQIRKRPGTHPSDGRLWQYWYVQPYIH